MQQKLGDFQPETIRRYIDDVLHNRINYVVERAIGFDSFNRIDRNSPLFRAVYSLATENAAEFAAKHFQPEFRKLVESEKWHKIAKKIIQDTSREMLESALEQAIKDVAARKATLEAERLINEAFAQEENDAPNDLRS